MGKRITGSQGEGAAALDLFATGYVVDDALHQVGVGDWLTSRYRVEGKLGEGGMGMVLRCWDDWRQSEVALKLLHPSLSSSSLDQLRKELRFQERCQHEGIARVFDLGRVELPGVSGGWFLTMELVEGRSLRDVLEQARGDGALPLLAWDDWSLWMDELVEALAHAHEKGVIHRDLKPSNLVLTPSGGARLLDFGIAAMSDSEGDSSTGGGGMGISGTAYYMAPEQLEVGGAITPATDLYALAAIVYEVLTGKLVSGRIEGPWAWLSQSGVSPSFSASVDDVVLRALSQRPQARYQDVRAFWLALRTAMTEPMEYSPLAQKSEQEQARGEKGVVVVASEGASGEPFSSVVKTRFEDGSDEDPGWQLETEKGVYRFHQVVAEGDLSSVWSGVVVSGGAAGQAIIAKIVDEVEDNDLMRDEIRVLQLLRAGTAQQHKHLPVPIDQFATEGGHLGQIQERFDGYDLDAVKAVYPQGIPQEHAFWLMRRVLSVLGYAHSLGILHGNIEPAHIMLRPRDHNVLLLDWSYAVVDPAQTGQGFKCINEDFSPPEVAARKPPVPASDIYSFGKTMIDLLGGDIHTCELPDAIDPRLARLLQFMTRTSALQRPRDAWQLYHQVNQMRKAIFGKHTFLEFSMPSDNPVG